MKTVLFAAGAVVTALLFAACTPAASPGALSPSSAERFSPASWTFDQDAPGALPPGASVFSGQWAVRAEPGTPSPPNALCQTASAEFPAIQLSRDVHRDMRVTAQVKPISGHEDQAAGVLLRVRDAKNYYIVRANALEENVTIFKYVDGRRIEMKSGSATVSAGSWHQLRGEVVGSTIRGYLAGQLVVEATDTTFVEGGMGLWTKSDSVTCFDDVTLAPVSGP